MKRWIWCLIAAVAVAGCAVWTQVGGPFTDDEMNFSVTLPDQWKRLKAVKEQVVLTHDGLMLQEIMIGRKVVDSALANTRKRLRRGMLPQESAEVFEDDLRSTPGLANVEIVENSPAVIDGVEGFRIHARASSPEGLRMRFVTYGFQLGSWVYLIEYRATERVYYERDLQTFERIKDSFRLIQRQ